MGKLFTSESVIWKRIATAILKSGVITWLILLVIWQIASAFNKPEFLPSPYVTWQGFVEILTKGVLWEDIKVSMRRVGIGWSCGLLVAIPIGLLIGRFRIVRWIVGPFINFFRFVPAIGFLTLFLMWFGVGEESKLEVMAQWAKMKNPPTAVYCANDAIAIGMLKYLNKKRNACYTPSIIGSDDIEAAQYTQPMLTTVALPKKEMAKFAVDLLLDRVQGGHTETVSLTLRTHLVVRSSCASPESSYTLEYYL